jgi:aspartyl-tRNA(Asn)/glutamyl-tRNA(Gln) amidotransferase subunit B
VHAQILTRSKMFCGCSTDYLTAPPNANTCPVCLALPGSLPVINRKAVEATIRTALALNCEIPEFTKFDRKNYFYPDLPKGYQISQYDLPLSRNGRLEFEVNGEPRRCGITRVHLEEDTGKLLHAGEIHLAQSSLVNLNRAGVPLMEIVGEPDLRSADEAREYFTRLRAILQYAGINNGDMESGQLRCDANVSIRPEGSTTYGTKVEVKNMNSFRSVHRAIEYEIERQVQVLEGGGTLVQETRGWNDPKGVTVSQRSKEYAHDYRYFPEPDLPPLVVTRDWVEAIRRTLPELPAARRDRFIATYGLKPYDAALLISTKPTAEFFEETVRLGTPAKTAANWILGDFSRLLNADHKEIQESSLRPTHLQELIHLIDTGVISGKMAKQTFEVMYRAVDPAPALEEAKRSSQITDQRELEELVDRVITENPKSASDFKAGKAQALQFLVGQAMKITKGRANPGGIMSVIRSRVASGQSNRGWRLRKPPGIGREAEKNMSAYLAALAEYSMVSQSEDSWIIERIGQTPDMFSSLPFRLIGKADPEPFRSAVTAALNEWPFDAGLENESLAKAGIAGLKSLDGDLPEDTWDRVKTLIQCHDEADKVVKGAPKKDYGKYIIRLAAELLRIFPEGQLSVWARSVNYLKAHSAIHLLATAEWLGFDAAREALGSGSQGYMWGTDEEITFAHPGSMYFNLLETGPAGFAFETMPFVFFFDFGRQIQVRPLDVDSFRGLHSLSLVGASANLPDWWLKHPEFPIDARSPIQMWFLEGYNRLAHALAAWENFKTQDGDLKPGVQWQANTTVGRILNKTAHLLAASELGTVDSDFWDLIDLYAGLQNVHARRLFEPDYWRQMVVDSLEGLPGPIRPYLVGRASEMYAFWVKDCVRGIIQPSRRQLDSVVIGEPGNTKMIGNAEFFASHMSVRRNTLHGYKLDSPELYRDFIASHNGQLPGAIWEWGRYMLYALLAKPDKFVAWYSELTK